MKLEELIVTEAKKESGGTYAAYRFNSSDIQKLRAWAKEHNIPNRVPREKIHCTLLYSRKPCPNYKPLGTLDAPLVAEPAGFDIWSTQDDKHALVLKLKAPDIVKRHKELMKEHEATYDYDTYKPHITISYDVGADFEKPSIDSIKKVLPQIRATEEYGEDLVDDWASKN